VHAEHQLAHVALAVGPPPRLADALHAGEDEAHEHGDDRDHDQQFHERERGAGRPDGRDPGRLGRHDRHVGIGREREPFVGFGGDRGGEGGHG